MTRWHLLVVAAVVPVLVGALLLQLMAPLDPPVAVSEIAAAAAGAPRHLPGLVTLIAVLTVHVCVCLGGIGLAAATVRPRAEDRALLRFALLAATAIVAGILIVQSPRVEAYRLSYFYFAEIYAGTAPGGLLRGATLELAMLLPTVLGIYGVAAITAASAGLLRAIPAPPPLPERGHEIMLRRVHGRLKRFLYILAIGLVASTLAVSIFFGLPGNLPACRAEDAAKAAASACRALDDFAGEMSTFWGAVLSLALFFCGGLPLLILQHKVRCYLETSLDHEPVEEAEKRLTETGLLSDGAEQVKVALTVLAPLASGPVAGTVAGLANMGI